MPPPRKTKSPKIPWFCRPCGKLQNRKAAPRPTPICAGCGRTMETDHYLGDVPVDDFGLARETTLPEPPNNLGAGSSDGRSSHAATIAMRLVDHENRIARLEKSPATIVAELERALLVMDSDQLAGLDGMLGRTVERLESIRGTVRRLRGTGDGN